MANTTERGPGLAPVDYLRALDFYHAGRLRDALDTCVRYLAATPQPHPPTLTLLGRVLLESGHPTEAARELERSLAIDAGDVGAWLSLAQAKVRLGHKPKANECVNKALFLSGLDAHVNAISAAVLLETGELDAAHASALKATQLDPRFAPGWFNLALVLQAQERVVDAHVAARRAWELDPGLDSHAGLAAQLAAENGDLAGASGILATALARQPDSAALHLQSAWIATRDGDLPAAIDHYARVLALQPANGAALSELIFCKKQLLDWQGLGALQQRFAEGVAAGQPLLTPFSFLSDPSTRTQQLRCAQTWSAGFSGNGEHAKFDPVLPTSPLVEVAAAPRIRIGYLSADFHQHPTSVLLAGVLERHDRERFEIFVYSTGPDDQSAMRERIKRGVEHFVDIRERRPEQLAARIRQDLLDVLVDLKGHTEGAASAALALRPAPLQAHWVGYPGALGASYIDYLFADRAVVPDAHLSDYGESIVWLPQSCQPNDRSRNAADAPARESLGLPDTGVLLANFNAAWKFNPAVFDAWARILAAVPASALWLLARDRGDPLIDNARREFADRGIAPERIAFAMRRAEADYLALYRHVDLFLDTWPYNAHTTASDALWMGCPLVTFAGETFAGRVAASVLYAAGVGELVAGNVDGYIALAVALAGDTDRRARLRQRLLLARDGSTLFDAESMTRNVESAFERMIEQRRSGIRESFHVTPT